MRAALRRYDDHPSGTLDQQEFEALIADISNGEISEVKKSSAAAPAPAGATTAGGGATPVASVVEENRWLRAEVEQLRAQLDEAYATIEQLVQQPAEYRRRSGPVGGVYSPPRQRPAWH